MTTTAPVRTDGSDEVLDTLANRIGRLERRADAHGFSRGHVHGYVQALHACFERVRCGGIADAEYLTALLYRPLLCRFCGDPLSEVQRLMGDFCDPCGKNGEDAR